MTTPNIPLPLELTSFIHEKVSTGMYRSASEVVHTGLLLLKEQDDILLIRLQELKQEIAVGTCKFHAKTRIDSA